MALPFSPAATSYRNTSSIPLLRILTSPSASPPSDAHKSTLPFLSWPPNHRPPRHPLTTRAHSRPTNRTPSSTPPLPNINKRNSSVKEGKAEKGEEDALEALFSMLEEDLKNDEEEEEEDDEITEEDMDKLQRELEEALGVDVDGFDSLEVVSRDNGAADEGEDEEEEGERPVKLKTWQLRRLAFALKTGRRKTSIKSLAGELCLDRAVVLEYLRDPPPSLVMMSAALPDEPAARLVIPECKPLDDVPVEKKSVDDTASVVGEPGGEVNVPIHVMRHQWYARKRLKKAQVQTLERVYRRTKRPTNAMISSIVQVLNLPRKKVVKWFEDKRSEDGVPDQRLPYMRSVSESTSSY